MMKMPMLVLAVVAAAIPATTEASDAELHTFHCLNGCPVGAPATNDVVVREIYTLSSDDLTKIADLGRLPRYEGIDRSVGRPRMAGRPMA